MLVRYGTGDGIAHYDGQGQAQSSYTDPLLAPPGYTHSCAFRSNAFA